MGSGLKFCLSLLGAFAFAMVGVAAEKGSCYTDAEDLGTLTTSEGYRDVKLVTTYNEISHDTGGAGYYYKARLTKGKSYVFWVTNPGRKDDFSVGYNPNDDSHPRSVFKRYELNGVQYYMIRANEWNSADPATCTYYVVFECFSLSSKAGRLHFKQGEVTISTPGEPDDPIMLNVASDGIVTNTFSAGGKDNAYYFNANLIAGKKYRFETLFGTATVPADIQIRVKSGIIDDNPGEMTVVRMGSNVCIDLLAEKTALYEIRVIGPSYPGTPQPIRLAYGRFVSRLPKDHSPLGPLSVGSGITCTPGYMRIPGSLYSDDVIDEQLISFSAMAGHRYRFTTVGAYPAIPLKAVIYDADGVKLATSTGTNLSAERSVAFEAPESATYYVGFCVDEDRVSTVVKSPVTIRMEELGDPENEDAVTVLHPPLILDASKLPQEVDTSDQAPSSLSSNRWCNLFAFACQSNFVYRLRAALVDDFADVPVPGLSAKVYRMVGGKEVEVVTDGSVSPEDLTSHYLNFRAFADEVYYVRVTTAAGNAYDFPPYRLRSCTYNMQDGAYCGRLTVTAKGVSSDAGTGWTSGRMHYPFGTTIYVHGTYPIAFDAVQGMSKPAPTNVTVSAGSDVKVVAAYNDTYDPGDDVSTGAFKLTVSDAVSTTSPRSLWAGADPADWFSFVGKAGYYYEFKLENVTGNPVIVVCGPDATETLFVGTEVAYPVQADGTYFVKVIHNPTVTALDSGYSLSYRSVNVGTVSFTQSAVDCSESSGAVRLKIRRTQNNGTVRVNWGTVAGTATPGEDYHAAGGTVVFKDGGTLEAEVEVRIIPDILPVPEGKETFSVRLDPSLDIDGGEYLAVVTEPFAATVTIADADDGRKYPTVDPGEGYDPSVETADADLVQGAFTGVLRENDGYFATDSVKALAALSVTASGSSMTAEVEIAGETIPFALKARMPSCGFVQAVLTNGDSVLTVEIPEGTASSLQEALPPEGCAELLLAYPVGDAGGILYTDTVFYECPLFRVRNAQHLPMRKRLVPYVGRHTVALADEFGEFGDGYLSLEVGIDGIVSGQGRMADGSDLALDATAAFLVSDEYGGELLRIPLRSLSGQTLFGGTLSLFLQEKEPGVTNAVVRAWDDADFLIWNDDAITDFYGDSIRRTLIPFGGKFDTVKNLGGLFANADLRLEDSEECATISDGALVSSGNTLVLTLDRATGILSGANGAGVVLLSAADGNLASVMAAGALNGGEDVFRVTASSSSRDETEDWGFSVSLSFDGNGATQGVPEPIFAQTAETITLPMPDLSVFKRTGYGFVGWQTPVGIVPGGSEFKMSAKDFTAVALWELSGMDEVLGPGAKAFAFGTSGTAEWAPEGRSMRSGKIASTGESVLTATAKSSGELTFSWKVSCYNAAQYFGCRFTVVRDGTTVLEKTLTGEAEAKDETVDVLSGDVLSWTYYKKYATASGQDCAWVSDFRFGMKVEVSFEPGDDCETDLKPVMMYAGEKFGEGGNVLPSDADGTAKWTNHSLGHWYLKGDAEERDVAGTQIPSNAVMLVAKLIAKQRHVYFYDTDRVTPLHKPLSGVAGETVKLPGTNDVPKKTGYVLSGWKSVKGLLNPGAGFTLPETDTDMVAQWELDVADVLGAGAKAFAFGTSGAAEWAPEGQSMRSGKLASTGESVLTATAKSSGELTFSWKVSCYNAAQYFGCRFTVVRDGTTVLEKTLTGEAERTGEQVDVQMGDVLTWTYYKKYATVTGQDCAWVSDFRFGVKVEVSFEPGDDCETDLKPVMMYAGERFGEGGNALPSDADGTAKWTNHSLGHWYLKGDAEEKDVARTLIPSNAVTLVAKLIAKQRHVYFYDTDEVTPLHDPLSGVAGETVKLPGTNDVPKKAAYALSGWRSIIVFCGSDYGPGEAFTFPTNDTTMIAEWTLDYDRLDEILGAGAKAFSFSSGAFEGLSWSDYDWDGIPRWTPDGQSMRSGKLSTTGESALTATAKFSGELTFEWKTSCYNSMQNSGCCFLVVRNGNTVLERRLTGETAWMKETVDVQMGDELRWCYYKKSATASGQDCAWIRDFKFDRKTMVTFRAESTQGEVLTTNVTGFAGQETLGDYFDAMPKAVWATEMVTEWKTNGGERVTLDWVFPDEDATLVPVAVVPRKFFLTYDANGGAGAVPVDGHGYTNREEAVLLPPGDLRLDGYAFDGWTIGGKPYAAGDTYVFGAEDATAVAQWTLDVAEILGPGAKAFAFGTSGAAEWAPEGQSMRSGKISTGESVLTATAKSSGELTFSWKVSCYNAAQYLGCRFAVVRGGTTVTEKKLTGEVEVKDETVDVQMGDVLTWTYYKKYATVTGQDCAWVSDFRFGVKVEVSFEPGDDCETDLPPVMMYAGERFGEGGNALPSDADGTAKWTNHSLGHWYLKGDAEEKDVAGTQIPSNAVTLVAKLVAKRRYVRFYDEDGVASLHDPLSGVAGETVKLPGTDDVPKKAGYALSGWKSAKGAYAPGAGFELPEADTDMTALWALDGVDEVLGPGAKAFAFGTSGAAEWAPEGQSMRSGKLASTGESVLTATAKSSGELTFSWKVSCYNAAQYLGCRFAVVRGGTTVTEKKLTGEVEVKDETVDVQMGDVLTWTYYKKYATVTGQDCAWVSDFRFGVKVEVSFEPGDDCETDLKPVMMYAGERFGEGGNALPSDADGTAKWTNHSLDHWYLKGDAEEKDVAGTLIPSNAVTLVAKLVAKRRYVRFYDEDGVTSLHDPLSGVAGETVKLPGTNDVPKKAGYALSGWKSAKGTYAPGAGFELPEADTDMTALWTLDGVDEVLGPGAKAFAFGTSGAAEWAPEGQSMRSGKIASTGESVLTATAKSSGELTFSWKVSCYDYVQYFGCRFTVVRDGKTVLEKTQTGETAWKEGTKWKAEPVDVKAGDVLSWTYYKKYSYVSGQDCAWVRNFAFKSDAPVDFSNVELPIKDGTKPSDIGITDGAFAKSGAAELTKLVAWAKTHGVLVVTVNAMGFDAEGNPLDLPSTAYLFNCEPTQSVVDQAISEFRIPSISRNADGSWTVADPVGEFNGVVRMLKAASPTGPWSEATAEEDGHLFFRAKLVRE